MKAESLFSMWIRCVAFAALATPLLAQSPPPAPQATPTPSPLRRAEQLGIIQGDFLGFASPSSKVSVASFSVSLTRALNISTPPPSNAPPGKANWYYGSVRATYNFFSPSLQREIKPSNPTLSTINIDRENAAVAAVTGAYHLNAIRGEIPTLAAPPPGTDDVSPPPFADENEITGGPENVSACHKAVTLGYMSVGLDNKFYPHRLLTKAELAQITLALREDLTSNGP